MIKKFLYGAALLFCAFQSPPAEVIKFTNPSFEGTAGVSTPIGGWASFTPESSPDLLPGAWNEMHEASHGATCLGLVIRKDGTSEDIGQFLQEPIQKGVCYKFSADLAKATHYARHKKPARIRIWGGTKKGEKKQVLASSPLVSHIEWKRYTLRFVPKETYTYLIIEAYYAPGAIFKYQGNILVDNLSVIERCIRA